MDKTEWMLKSMYGLCIWKHVFDLKLRKKKFLDLYSSLKIKSAIHFYLFLQKNISDKNNSKNNYII